MRPVLLACLFSAVLSLAANPLRAMELPTPAALEQESRLSRQAIEVAEPHTSTQDKPFRVAYVGLPILPLLDRWYWAAWREPGTDVLFYAEDGYRAAVPAAKLERYGAYLAFARADGQPFEVDNREQNETVQLGPYYLVWDNLKAPELFRQGSAGWPYQVERIDLHRQSDDRALTPAKADEAMLAGLAATQSNCLACHQLRGIGGEKYPEDLTRSLCRWNADDLALWIDKPAKLRPGTAMPALSRMWSAEERARVTSRIVRYLMAIKASDPAACGK